MLDVLDPFVLQGHGGNSMGDASMAAWRQDAIATVRENRGKKNRKEVPGILKTKLQLGPAAGFNHLTRAPGHFLKSQRNSYNLELTFRTITKIGEVK